MSTLHVGGIQSTETVAEQVKSLDFNPDIFAAKFNREPFLIEHHLADHPLLQLPALIELSRRLDPASVKYNNGTLSVSADLENAPANGLSAEETIRRIEECHSWMVLKNVQNDSAYRELLTQCLDEVRIHSEPLETGMCDARAFIFISSPHSITPFHIDPEINFLLQIRGRKTVSIFSPFDREILPEQTIERFCLAENLSLLTFNEEFRDRAFVAHLSPGIGVHCPVMAPHWVQNGPDVSVSFSITFRSSQSKRQRNIYWLNAQLRRFGFAPSPVGKSPWQDELKYKAFAGLSKVARAIR
ncbi:MAG: cupin-like domain-containing protein [Acidobacteria bacterium]|nr:cupin-like domain-containing protein [Acidobacteriota bacterium]MBV9147824.1 cupin-like domain-containing protein [Acidobacteriota bacterium]MBV9436563.1 cupin-like domain-containing protein [Acidobacteriota bacterium]